MTRSRSTSIWHIPKRASLHQMIGAVNIIQKLDIDGKAWPQSRKFFDQKFAMWGFTTRRRSLSKNASETFEALMKYLGLITINDGRIHLTQCGKKLALEHPIYEPQIKKQPLTKTIKMMGVDIVSNILANQMMKIYLTNPTIIQYCSEIDLFPFRETLRLLLDKEIQYITQNEIGYILFNMKNTTELLTIKQQILTFRSLSNEKKNQIIKNYKITPEGNLTLVQAPTATYWRQLCENTGLCYSNNQILKIKEGKKKDIEKLLSSYSDNSFNFKRDEILWEEYFGNCDIKSTPIIVTINVNGIIEDLLMSVKSNGKHVIQIIDKSILEITVFPNVEYYFEFIDILTEKTIKSIAYSFKNSSDKLNIDISKNSQNSFEDYDKKILELIQSKDYDDYYKHLINILNKKTGIDFANHKASLRGGRLEFLFYMHLKKLESLGKISDLHWNGWIDKYGLARPALGTNKGQPDITFQCGSYQFLLELTTIKGATIQWQAEGVSVPFHIRNFVQTTGIDRVIGIFSPPITHEKIHESMLSSRLPDHYNILYISIENLLTALTEENLGKKLLKLTKESNPDFD